VPGDHSRYVPSIGFCRARNRIEATETEYFLGCDRVGVYRTPIQAGAYGRVAEYDMSAK
jgi:hypothetical protein